MNDFIQHAEFIFIPELLNLNKEDAEGKMYRVTGKITSYDPQSSSAVMVNNPTSKVGDEQSAIITISTTNVEPFQFSVVGHMVQCIGEVVYSDKLPTLLGRHLRCVDGLNIALFEQTVKSQRRFLNKVPREKFTNNEQS